MLPRRLILAHVIVALPEGASASKPRLPVVFNIHQATNATSTWRDDSRYAIAAIAAIGRSSEALASWHTHL